MRIWKLKDAHRTGLLEPHDLVCIELGTHVLYIQEEGTWDVSLADDGMPTDGMWDLIAGEDE